MKIDLYGGSLSLNPEEQFTLQKSIRYFARISRHIEVEGDEALRTAFSGLINIPSSPKIVFSSTGLRLILGNDSPERYTEYLSKINLALADPRSVGVSYVKLRFGIPEFAIMNPVSGDTHPYIDFSFLPTNFICSKDFAAFAGCIFTNMLEDLTNPSAMVVIDAVDAIAYLYSDHLTSEA